MRHPQRTKVILQVDQIGHPLLYVSLFIENGIKF